MVHISKKFVLLLVLVALSASAFVALSCGDESLKEIASLKSRAVCLAYSPDGKMLAAGAQGEVVVWETATWKQRLALPAENEEHMVSQVAFSPDGKWLAVCCGDNVHLYDLLKAKVAATVAKGAAHVAFASSGKYLVTIIAGHGIHVRDIPSLAEKRPFKISVDRLWFRGLFVSDEQVSIVYSQLTSRDDGSLEPYLLIYRFDTETGRENPPERVDKFPGELLTFSARANLLAGASRGSHAIRLWNTRTNSPHQVPGLTDTPEPADCLAFSGRLLAFSTGAEKKRSFCMSGTWKRSDG